jgi:hypothetical protein
MGDWIKIADQPPGKCGDQVDVIFGHPDWGWPMWGMVTCWGTLEEWVAKGGSPITYPGIDFEWFIYDQENDRYRPWNELAPQEGEPLWPPRRDLRMQPTHWMLRPSSPPKN